MKINKRKQVILEKKKFNSFIKREERIRSNIMLLPTLQQPNMCGHVKVYKHYLTTFLIDVGLFKKFK